MTEPFKHSLKQRPMDDLRPEDRDAWAKLLHEIGAQDPFENQALRHDWNCGLLRGDGVCTCGYEDNP